MNINVFKIIIKLKVFNQSYNILIIIKNNDNENEDEIFEFWLNLYYESAFYLSRIIIIKNVDYRFENNEVKIVEKPFELNRLFDDLNLINIFDFTNK